MCERGSFKSPTTIGCSPIGTSEQSALAGVLKQRLVKYQRAIGTRLNKCSGFDRAPPLSAALVDRGAAQASIRAPCGTSQAVSSAILSKIALLCCRLPEIGNVLSFSVELVRSGPARSESAVAIYSIVSLDIRLPSSILVEVTLNNLGHAIQNVHATTRTTTSSVFDPVAFDTGGDQSLACFELNRNCDPAIRSGASR
jgi:hypothetical protein